MGGQRSEVQPTTTRVLMEAANWNGPNIQRTSQRLGLRTEASGRFEKGLAPEQTMRRPGGGDAADDRAVRRAAGRRARSTSAGRARSRRRCGCATRRSRGLLGTAGPARRRRPSSSSGSSFGVVDGGDGLDVTVPALPPQRRHPRGRPDRGGRAALGAGEAPGHAALAPRRLRPADAPSSGCAAGPATRSSARASRGDRLELPGAGDRRAGCGSPTSRPVRAAQPAVRGPVA